MNECVTHSISTSFLTEGSWGNHGHPPAVASGSLSALLGFHHASDVPSPDASGREAERASRTHCTDEEAKAGGSSPSPA